MQSVCLGVGTNTFSFSFHILSILTGKTANEGLKVDSEESFPVHPQGYLILALNGHANLLYRVQLFLANPADTYA